MSGIVLVHAVSGTVVVAAHHEKDLIIALDELIPQSLAIVIGIEDVSFTIDIERLMSCLLYTSDAADE